MINKKLEIQQEGTSPALGCDYHGRHFGAPYPDAQCINGYLWDEDSGDGDGLTSGGDAACPQCNTVVYLGELATDLQEGICGRDHNPTIWLGNLNVCFELNPEGTRKALRELGEVRPIYDDCNAPDGVSEAIFSYGHQLVPAYYQSTKWGHHAK